MAPPDSDKPPDLQERIFDAGLVKISYVEGPKNGRPLVLLHGLARNWQDFLSLIPTLAQSWHVYAVDLRGHGSSGRVARGYTGASYAADLVALFREVLRQPAVLFGHSMGGVVAMRIAAGHPELVRALILGDTVLSHIRLSHSMYPVLFAALHKLVLEGGSVQEMAVKLARVTIHVPGLDYPVPIGDLPGNEEGNLLKWAAVLKQVDPETLAMTLDGSTLGDYDGEALLRNVKCPTLILQANPHLGGVLTNAEVERAVRLLVHGKLVRFPLLGHVLHLQQPEPVLKAVCDFLNSL